jgi:cell wall-associated NlpC family hydrolase
MTTESPAPFMPAPTPACLVDGRLTTDREIELRQAVVREALSWVGTPYVQLGDVKGPAGAIDCSMLLVRSYVDAGVFAPFDPRPYPPNWHMHHSEERYLAWLNTLGTEVPAPIAGDVVVMRFGMCFSHGGVMVDETRVVHALAQHGTCAVTDLREAFIEFERVRDAVKKRMVWAPRPKKFFNIFAGVRRWADEQAAEA